MLAFSSIKRNSLRLLISRPSFARKVDYVKINHVVLHTLQHIRLRAVYLELRV